MPARSTASWFITRQYLRWNVWRGTNNHLGLYGVSADRCPIDSLCTRTIICSHNHALAPYSMIVTVFAYTFTCSRALERKLSYTSVRLYWVNQRYMYSHTRPMVHLSQDWLIWMGVVRCGNSVFMSKLRRLSKTIVDSCNIIYLKKNLKIANNNKRNSD